MSFGDAVRSVLLQYATFSGRARRSEYWWWYLAQSLVLTVLYLVGLLLLAAGAATAGQGSELGAAAVVGLLVLAALGLLSLALLLPSLGVLVRRLHDTGRSGWWVLATFVPFGGIVLLVFTVMDSTPGTNEYGPNPKGVGDHAYGLPSGYAQPGPDPRWGVPQA